MSPSLFRPALITLALPGDAMTSQVSDLLAAACCITWRAVPDAAGWGGVESVVLEHGLQQLRRLVLGRPLLFDGLGAISQLAGAWSEVAEAAVLDPLDAETLGRAAGVLVQLVGTRLMGAQPRSTDRMRPRSRAR